MTGAGVRLVCKDAIARVQLDRPSCGNAIDLPMAEALGDAAISCDLDPRTRCVMLIGSGRLFCGGGDVRSFAAAGSGAPRLIKEITGHLHLAMSRFARMAKPLLVVANGPAAGAGLGLLCAGDIVLAARSAYFTAGYTGVGLSPDAGLSWTLPRLIGLRRAQELILTNRRLSSDEALAMGLVTAVAEDDELEERAEALAQQLAQGATGAMGRTRRLLLSSFCNSLETQLELESRAISAAAATIHGMEGMAAYDQRRAPNFR